MEATTVNYKTVSPEEFAKDINSSDIFLLDVRHPEEYESGHIKDAKNLDVMSSDFVELAEKELPKDMTIAVYCGSGKRSGMASDILSKKGYRILNLDGGLTAWKNAGLPVTE